MSFPLHAAGPFTNDVSLIPASFLNDMRLWITQAVDGSAGGTYIGPITWTGIQTFENTVYFNQGTNQLAEKKKRTGTGTANGDELRIRGQTGQDQTGGAGNNNGGSLVLEAGAPGTGGSGAVGKRGYHSKEWGGSGVKFHAFGDGFTVAGAGGTKVCDFVFNPPNGSHGWVETTATARDTDNNETIITRVRDRWKKSSGGTLTLANATTEFAQGDFGTPPTVVHLNTSDTIELQANNNGANNNLEWGVHTEIFVAP